MKKDIKPFLFFSIIASLLVGHLANRTALIFEGLTGNLVENINAAIDAIIPALQNNPFMIGTSKTALISGAIGAACVWLIFLYNVFGAKNFMRGSEHGSARWGTAKDIKPLTDREPDMNIPLSATEQISVRKVKDFEADRNKNIVVVGGSGSGKTYSEIKPSLMQLHSSYVITDPKGTILPETGYLFTNNGYTVRSFNTIDFSKSLHYNPLAYIHKEKDILKVVTVLMENTNGEGTGSGEKFWKDCEKLLYTALIAYLWYEAPPEDQNIPMMIEMLDMCKVKEDDEDYQSPIDIMFEDLEKEKPNCLAVKQYKKFKQAAGVVCSKRLLNQAVWKSLRTHNLKPKKGAQVMKKNEKITALYERLSRDDFGKDDDQQRESNSISNQKAMLEEFAARQGFTNIVHFTDDGISGTCFDRPGFLAMMKEVEAGNVEYLCIKDMSRMGRDYLKVGQIMEILRQRGVRLIAINDGVDSARGDDDFTPFRNIMKNISHSGKGRNDFSLFGRF